MVKLYLRNEQPAPGMPGDISSVFNTQEEALAQAVHDIQQGGRTENTGYAPQRIEAEDGTVLVDHAELQAAAA
jgi:hypothetical protein